MTFHSACCRILRREIQRLGYSSSFTIYDTSDSERLMKDIIKDMGLDEKSFPAKYVLSVISREKVNRIARIFFMGSPPFRYQDHGAAPADPDHGRSISGKP